MAEAIADCEAVICRGMGAGAYEGKKARDIRVEAIEEVALLISTESW